MKINKVVLGVSLIVISAFLIRVIPQWNNIFTSYGVLYHDVDTYLHLRLIENMIANFPIALSIDKYALLGGMDIGFPPLWNWLVVIISKVGIDYHYVDAFLPPILGALTAVPVYLIGRTLFNRSIGIVASLICVLLPSEFLHRTLLGFSDHHALEIFFMAWVLFFVVKFCKVLNYKWAILSGLFLGLYMDSWLGGMFFVAILLTGFMFQFAHQPCKKIIYGFSLMFLIAYIATFLYYGEPYRAGNINFMPVAIALPLLFIPYTLMNDKRISIILIGCGLLLGGGLAYGIYSEEIVFALRSIFWGFGSIISEAQPAYPYVFVSTLGVSVLLMFGGLYYATKRESLSPLFLVWWAVLFIAMIGQRRWGYYFTMPVSILSAVLLVNLTECVKPNLKKIILGLTVFFVLISSARTIIGVSSVKPYVNEYYITACEWLRNNTPEPFSRDYYYSLDTNGELPDYVVLAWWDYGHWINEIGHRVVLSNPASQISIEMREYLLAQSQAEAEGIIADLPVKYIFATKELTGANKFYAVVFQLGFVDVEGYIKDSMAVRLWTGEGITYKLVYENKEVKIYER